MIRKGFEFTHQYFIDPAWDGPVRDGPRALMVVTRTDSHRVWYGYADGCTPGRWVVDRETFEKRYGGTR